MNDMVATTNTWIIIGTALVWAGWDIYLYVTNQETISVKLNRWGKHVMAIVFLVGFLCGHWWW